MPPSLNLPDPQDNTNLFILNTFIENGSCVLFLGPLFSIDADGNKIHLKLKNFLTDPPNNLLLDDEFDNLYISKKSDGSQNAAIMAGITSFYRSIGRSNVYDKLLGIGFQAIVSFSSDILFKEANDTRNEYDFLAFNKKGNESESQKDTPETISKKPIIYNVFGDMRDLNALIVDYDSLYEFLLNIIKADSQIPLRLKDILGKATAFLFLGFDLNRWYIPIIIRKLNQFILNNRSKGIINGFACLDDTPIVPPKEVQDSLNKYPLQFKVFTATGTIDLINHLSARKRSNTQDEKISEDTLPPNEQLSFFKDWHFHYMNLDFETSLKNFFQAYKQMNYRSMCKKEFDGQSMEYSNTLVNKNLGIINYEDYKTRMNRIIWSLVGIIEKLLNTTEK